MKKVLSVSLSTLLALMMLAVSATFVFAAPPLDLHIEVSEVIGTSGEPFTASGSAVGAGLVCPTGTVDDISVVVKGNPVSGKQTLKVLKRFNCDGGGTFDVKLNVRLDLTTRATTAQWKIVSGTGVYSGLKGNGSLVGTPIVPGTSILDVYDGKAH